MKMITASRPSPNICHPFAVYELCWSPN